MQSALKCFQVTLTPQTAAAETLVAKWNQSYPVDHRHTMAVFPSEDIMTQHNGRFFGMFMQMTSAADKAIVEIGEKGLPNEEFDRFYALNEVSMGYVQDPASLKKDGDAYGEINLFANEATRDAEMTARRELSFMEGVLIEPILIELTEVAEPVVLA